NRRGAWVALPVGFGVVALLLAYLLRVRRGTATLSGAEASHVDPLVVLAPLVFIFAVLTVLAVALVVVLRRVRTPGARLRPALTLGVRRALGDRPAAVVTTGAVALCVATFVYASTLSTSIRTSILAKARAFAGADARVAVTNAPRAGRSLPPNTTLVTRAAGT